MTKTNPKVVLICPHDGDHKEFLEEHLEIAEIYKDCPDLLERYLNLERDHGASKLAQTIKDFLKNKGLESSFIHIENIPRGIIDANRILEKAIRNIFNHKKRPQLTRKFKEIYEKTTTQALQALANLGTDGLFLDVHTMIDFSPSELIPITPGKDAMQKYIEARTNPDRLKKRRQINFLTARANEASLAHPKLATNLEKGFDTINLKVSHNDPYRLLDWTMLNHYMSKYPQKGIGIDIPICELSMEGESCEINPKLDPQKISEKGEIIASAILKSLA